MPKKSNKNSKRLIWTFIFLSIIIVGFVLFNYIQNGALFISQFSNDPSLINQNFLTSVKENSNINIGEEKIKTKTIASDKYYIHKKTGNESFFDVRFEDVFIDEEQISIDNETVNVSKKYINISFVADFETKELDNESKSTYEVPTTFNLYKDSEKTESKKSILTRELDEKEGKDSKDQDKFKKGDKYTFSYLADPLNETFLKFGENSIELTSTILITEVLFEQSVAEPNYIHQNVSDNDVVLYMSFDHDNSTNIYDYSNYNNDGTTVGNANPNGTGLNGDALNLDGTGDYVDIPDSPSIRLGGTGASFSFSYWINPRSIAGTQQILSSHTGDCSTTGFANFYFTDNNYYFQFRANDGTCKANIIASSNIPANEWSHVTGTYNTTTQKLYVNGVLKDTDLYTGSMDITTTGIDIGQDHSAGGSNFNGLLDEVKLYNKSLSASEITEIYRNESSIFQATPNNYTLQTFNMTLTTEDKLNVSARFYERLQGTNISLRIGEWNFTDNYDESDPDLLLDMHFDNRSDLGENSSYLLDSSSFGNNGTTGGNAIVNVTGKYHTGITLDGTNGYVQMPEDDGDFDFTTNVTLSAWVNLATQGASSGFNDYVFDKQNHYSLIVEHDLTISWYGGAFITTTDTITTGNWHFISVTFDKDLVSNNVKIYIDGELSKEGTRTSPLATSNNPLRIGCYSNGGGSCSANWGFDGLIDDAKVHGRVLTAQEVRRLYITGRLNYTYTDPQNLTDFNSTDSINTFTVDFASTQFSPEFTLVNNLNNSYSSLVDIGSNIDYNFFETASGPTCGSLTEDTTLLNDVNSSGTCFTIDAHNVDLYCNGYNIFYATGVTGNGIIDTVGYENTTINNCNILANNSANSQSPLSFMGSSKINITGNNLSMTSDVSAYPIISLSLTNNVRINNNNISQQSAYQGIDLGSSTGTYIESNKFEVTNTMSGSRAIYNSGNAPDTVIENNTIFTNSSGIVFDDNGVSFPNLINISSNNFSGSQDDFNIKIGSYTSSGLPNILRDQSHNVGNFSFNTFIIIKDTTYGEIDWFAYSTGIGLSVSGTNLSEVVTFGNASLFVDESFSMGALNFSLNLTMFNSPSAGLTEPLIFRNGVYCPTEECFNFTAIESTTLFFNSTSAGNFTIQSNASGDTTPPNVTGLSVSPPSPVIYSPSAVEYNFTANITDETSLGAVLFEFEGVNYTGTNTVESRYNLTVSKILGVGTYNVRISATDTAGNVNNTEVISLVVNRATAQVNLTLNSLDQDISIAQGDSVNITGFEITGDTEFIYTRQDGSLINNGTSPVSNVTTYNDVGTFFINLTYPTSQNYTTISESHTITVNDTTNPQATVVEFPTSPTTYVFGQNYNFNFTISDNIAIDTVLFEFRGINYTLSELGATGIYNITFSDLNASTNPYILFVNDSSNNINSSIQQTYTINRATPTGSITGTTPITHPTAGDFQGIETNNGDGDLNYVLFRNNVSVSNPDTTSLGAGSYTYLFNVTQGENYTSVASLDLSDLVVNKATSQVNLTLDGNDANVTVEVGSTVNLTGFTISGVGNIELYSNGSLLNNATGTISNLTAYNFLGNFNVTLILPESENFTSSFEDHFVLVTDTNRPSVTSLTESPSDPATYVSGARYEFNATVTDSFSLDTVRLEFNGTTYTATNLTATASGSIFNVSVYDLGVGQYSYRWFANDSSGNVNDTETGIYTVNKGAGVVSTFIDGVSSGKTINNNTNANLSGSLDTGIGEINLLKDGGLLNNGTNFISNITLFDIVGSFIINTTYAGNENFTATSEAFTLVVQAPATSSGLSGSDMLFGYNIGDVNDENIDTLRFSYSR